MAIVKLTSTTASALFTAIENIENGDIIVPMDGTYNLGLNKITSPKTFSIIKKGAQTTFKTDLMTNYDEEPIRWSNTIDIPMRISGIRWEGILDSNNHNNLFQIRGACKQLRIDHCYFTHGGSHSMMIDGDIQGLIDHNIFYDDAVESISTRNSVNQDQIWDDQPEIGDGACITMEDNEFYFLTRGTHACTTVNGQRTIFRHNSIESTFNGALIDFHGNFENSRGTYSFEVYDNEIYCPNDIYISYGVYARSGKGVIYNNSFRTNYSNRLVYPVCLTNYRSWSTNYQHFTTCSDTGVNANVHTYEDARLYDSVRDVYIWDNVYLNNGVSENVVGEVIARGHDQDHIQENRDYFNYAMPGYVEYQYPHPLNINYDISAPVSTGVSI